MKMILKLLFPSRFWLDIKFQKRKAHKKELNEKLMPIWQHHRRQWNFCMSEEVKKEIETILTE